MNNEKRQLNYATMVFIVLALLVLVSLLTACRGPRGYTGNQGPQGPQGTPGLNGATPVVQTSPSTVAECPNGGVDLTVNSMTTSVCNGATGPQGQTGATGATGVTGATGATGAAGAAGTQIQFVQFCAGFVPSYPGTFPEYGIVVNNQVYGVYSANGGFLALLSPGEYSSDGINASCNFYINSDGTISQ